MNLILDMAAIGLVFALIMVLAIDVLLQKRGESDERVRRKLSRARL